MRKNIQTFTNAALFILLCINAAAQNSKPANYSHRYPNMPAIPPIGERIEKYLPVDPSAKGPAIDPKKGYRLQDLGKGLYMITDNFYQSMFLVYESGVVIVDVPPTIAKYIPAGIAEVTGKPVTHLVYTHSHIDHI